MDPRVTAAFELQLDLWRSALAAGAERVGWKIGFNTAAAQQQAGIVEPVVGHMTSATTIKYGAHLSLSGFTRPMVEPEVAIEVGDDNEAVALAAAIEIVDVNAPFSDVEAIVAGNIFHKAALLGDFRPNYPPPRKVAVLVNGHPSQETDVVQFDAMEPIDLVASTLAQAGERLEPGDKIIAGSLTPPVEVSPDDIVGVQLDNLGTVQLIFKP